MSNTEPTAGNGEKSALPNGLRQLVPPMLAPRERIALGILQSLLRAENPRTRKNRSKALAQEAFDLADDFLIVAQKEKAEGL